MKEISKEVSFFVSVVVNFWTRCPEVIRQKGGRSDAKNGDIAKDAGATVDLHRMAVADTFAIDRYLDENCLIEPEITDRKESVREMKKRNKDVEKIKRLVAEGCKSLLQGGWGDTH